MSKDVEYCVPNKKRPIAYSTRSVSDGLVAISNEGYNTPNEIISAIDSKYQLAFEERDVMEKYVQLGYGDLKLNLK